MKKITYPNILESINIDSKNSLIEVVVSKDMEGKTLKELKLREKYGILVFWKKAMKNMILL